MQGFVGYRSEDGAVIMNKTVHVRVIHRYAYHQNEWAKITGVEFREIEGLPPRMCYLVEFPDGATDSWTIYDEDAQYEFRNVSAESS